MNSVNLELNFTNTEGKNKKLSIRRPILGLTDAEVVPAMQALVESDIFDADGIDPYAAPKSARYIRTEVEEIYEQEA